MFAFLCIIIRNSNTILCYKISFESMKSNNLIDLDIKINSFIHMAFLLFDTVFVWILFSLIRSILDIYKMKI